MPTINQLIRKPRQAPVKRNKVPALEHDTQGVKDRKQRRSKYGAKRPK